ncbi:hypothetical protein L9F63_027869, partial [Diploptera punctata]
LVLRLESIICFLCHYLKTYIKMVFLMKFQQFLLSTTEKIARFGFQMATLLMEIPTIPTKIRSGIYNNRSFSTKAVHRGLLKDKVIQTINFGIYEEHFNPGIVPLALIINPVTVILS